MLSAASARQFLPARLARPHSRATTAAWNTTACASLRSAGHVAAVSAAPATVGLVPTVTAFFGAHPGSIAATRQLAKRQITWLTNSFAAENFDCLDPALSDRIATRVAGFLGD